MVRERKIGVGREGAGEWGSGKGLGSPCRHPLLGRSFCDPPDFPVHMGGSSSCIPSPPAVTSLPSSTPNMLKALRQGKPSVVWDTWSSFPDSA